MGKKFLNVKWQAINGAAKEKKILRLRPDGEGHFSCPVETCMHTGFKSSRGLRRHIDTRHRWMYWFEVEPAVRRNQLVTDPSKIRSKAVTHNVPSFSITEGIGADFRRWLSAPLGGGKNEREATQGAKRAMKFLLHVIGEDNTCDSLASIEFIDCAVGSASTITSFMETITNDWRMSSSGALNYLKSITDLADFRKTQGCPDEVLRAFSVTEVYLRRGKENLRRKKALDYSRNLDLETLIMKDSWCSLEDMNKVIPYHTKQFLEVYNTCKDAGSSPTINQLTFASRYIATYLFLMLKCSRPRTFQFLTTGMVERSKTNGGFVDQTEFKTASTYVFDTLVMDKEVLEVLDMYISVIRPKMNPQCDYVLVSTTGRQYTAFTVAMTLLVKQAIGKYVHPTRYRQIVETSSSERLSPEEQEIISADQKHSSNVARLSYKKKESRKVAVRGKECMKKMLASSMLESTVEVQTLLSPEMSCDNTIELANVLDSASNSMESIDEAVIEKTKEIMSVSPSSVSTTGIESQSSTESTVPNAMDIECIGDIEPTNNQTFCGNVEATSSSSTDCENIGCTRSDNDIKMDDNNEQPMWPHATQPIVDVKVEESDTRSLRPRKETVKFKPSEDRALVDGVKKYGKGSWYKILADPLFKFHPCRDRDALRIRYKSARVKSLLASG